jgi:hypothetical protein
MVISPLVLAEVPEVSFGGQGLLTANSSPDLALRVRKVMHRGELEEACESFLRHRIRCVRAFSVPKYLNVHSPRRL